MPPLAADYAELSRYAADRPLLPPIRFSSRPPRLRRRIFATLFEPFRRFAAFQADAFIDDADSADIAAAAS
jgi:hypothetical protein